MKYYLKAMEERLSEEERARLQSIYAPTVVTVPPCDACRALCVTPDGEIRIYGVKGKKFFEDDSAELVYASSLDGGITWKEHRAPSAACIGASGYNPKSGRYITAWPNEFRPGRLSPAPSEKGFFAVLTEGGCDATDLRFVKLSDKPVHCLKNPLYIEELDRWFIIGEYGVAGQYRHVYVYTSEDDGETWRENVLPMAPAFEQKPPHKGVRWQQYSCEPTVAHLGDGRMLMHVRTSQDYHYMHTSEDGGLTWSDPTPSPFHGTITMPVLYNLSDGRLVHFWCNTQPLPERDLHSVFPPLSQDDVNGVWEDVFTNRDANHLAISEDGGKTWIGMRELFLNTIRNRADFRSVGGLDSRDKSVHQAEILELPYNKLLVHFGQNVSARKVVILDLDWLYETERREDFRLGLENVSTQMYVESNLGGFRHFSGHCAYNRTNGALLVRDPRGNYEEVLQICRVPDPRLVEQRQGCVWNFPTSKQGRVTLTFSVVGAGVAFSLADRWMNPCDPTAPDCAFFSYELDGKTAEKGTFHTLTADYDAEKGEVTLALDGAPLGTFAAKNEAPLGISYLHLITLAEDADYDGTLIKYMEKTN